MVHVYNDFQQTLNMFFIQDISSILSIQPVYEYNIYTTVSKLKDSIFFVYDIGLSF